MFFVLISFKKYDVLSDSIAILVANFIAFITITFPTSIIKETDQETKQSIAAIVWLLQNVELINMKIHKNFFTEMFHDPSFLFFIAMPIAAGNLWWILLNCLLIYFNLHSIALFELFTILWLGITCLYAF